MFQRYFKEYLLHDNRLTSILGILNPVAKDINGTPKQMHAKVCRLFLI